VQRSPARTHSQLRRVFKSFLVALGLLVLVLAGEYVNLWLSVARLERADASRDAERALASGDRGLLGIDGAAGLDVPGADSAIYEAAAAGRCGVRIVHVGDRFVISLQEREQDAWFRYSRRYNGQLLASAGERRLCASATQRAVAAHEVALHPVRIQLSRWWLLSRSPGRLVGYTHYRARVDARILSILI